MKGEKDFDQSKTVIELIFHLYIYSQKDDKKTPQRMTKKNTTEDDKKIPQRMTKKIPQRMTKKNTTEDDKKKHPRG